MIDTAILRTTLQQQITTIRDAGREVDARYLQNDLDQEYTAAYHAIGKAIDALAATTLNARDYYPQASGAYYQARSERDEALDQLRKAQAYAGEMVAGIFDQL